MSIRIKQSIFYIVILYSFCFCGTSYAYCNNCTISIDSATNNNYQILSSNYYTFDELMDEGLNTAIQQLEVLHVPIKKMKLLIKWHIKRHDFILTKQLLKKKTFCATTFSYPSTNPQGEPTLLSGLVTMPVVPGDKVSRMLIYHRITATSNKTSPSHSIPIEAVICADNTICVFPDYYGYGISEGNVPPYISLNYNAKCATECALHALDIAIDMGIEFAEKFHTWNTGYSQGGGYALATQKYIETMLPDSLAKRLNLRWSLCAGGLYSPKKLFEVAISNNNLGSSPSIYLEGIKSLFYGHKKYFENIELKEFLSDSAIHLGIDTILQNNDNGYWATKELIEGKINGNCPADYFSKNIIDTSSVISKSTQKALRSDDCVYGWKPTVPIILYHSKGDKCIPFELTKITHDCLSDSSNNCVLTTPRFNFTHAFTAILYFAKILGNEEDKLYKKMMSAAKHSN